MKRFIFLLGVTLILIDSGHAVSWSADKYYKPIPVYKGRTPLAYKEYVPKSVRNQRALEAAGLTLPQPMSQEMREYLEQKRIKEGRPTYGGGIKTLDNNRPLEGGAEGVEYEEQVITQAEGEILDNAGSGEAFKQKKSGREKLAVLDLKAQFGVEVGFAEAYSILIRDAIYGYGEYEVMSRETMLQAMGCGEDGACLDSFNRALSTRFMVAGSLSKLGSTYNISLQLLDTQGANTEVVKRASGNCKCSEDELIVAVQQVASELMGHETSFTGAEEVQQISKVENND